MASIARSLNPLSWLGNAVKGAEESSFGPVESIGTQSTDEELLAAEFCGERKRRGR